MPLKNQPKPREAPILDHKRVNELIAGSEFVLIDSKGVNLGVVSREQAFFVADELGMDLVQVSTGPQGAITRLMDFGKQRYESEKRARKTRVKQKSGEMKEIKLSFKISEHDFRTRLNHAKRFLERGDQVKLTMRLVGRENAFVDQAREKFVQFATELGMQVSDVTKQGNRLNTVLRKK